MADTSSLLKSSEQALEELRARRLQESKKPLLRRSVLMDRERPTPVLELNLRAGQVAISFFAQFGMIAGVVDPESVFKNDE